MTPKQSQALEFISQHWRKQGYAPSYRELARLMKTSVSSAFRICERLENMGLVRKDSWGRLHSGAILRISPELLERAELMKGEGETADQYLNRKLRESMT